MAVKASARLIVKSDNDELPGAFGLGCVLLLQGVDEERSLNRAAKRMGMAYSKAWRIIKEAEAQLGCELLDRDGARGSSLTDEGRRAMEAYLELQDAMNETLRVKAAELFHGFGPSA